jgi:hypothetical protein
MAENDERLLNLLEPQATADLPAGYRYGRLADAGIGLPIAKLRPARRGNKVISVPTRESLATLKAAGTIRWPVISRDDAGEAAWAAMSTEVHAAQDEARRSMAPKLNTTVSASGARPSIVRGS